MVEQPGSIRLINPAVSGTGTGRIVRTGRDLTFSQVLQSHLERETGISFSAHAMGRLNDRGITLGSDEISRLSRAVSKSGEKGGNDSLILLNDMAFIVSIENSTVVTAMTGDDLKDNVFTNIDSAIIA
ncbi:TIGR02530 family flagellar biosynthesis protein [Candidatus Latescibacterota bacterium]